MPHTPTPPNSPSPCPALVLHHGALGDSILTWPLLRSLALHHPLILAAHASHARLANRMIPGVQPVDFDHPAWSCLFTSSLPDDPHPSLVPLLASVSLILSFVGPGTDDSLARNLHALAPAAALYLLKPNPPADFRLSVSAWHLAQLRAQGLPLMPAQPPLKSNPQGPIVLHPGSGGSAKCWPLEHFESLLLSLRRHGLPVLPVLGQVEAEQWPTAQIHHWVHDLHAQVLFTLDDLADLLQTARLHIGNDSGPSHLAAQLGVPTLTLFGPTPAEVWRPVGPGAEILAPPRPSPMTWLQPESVINKTLQMLRGPG